MALTPQQIKLLQGYAGPTTYAAYLKLGFTVSDIEQLYLATPSRDLRLVAATMLDTMATRAATVNKIKLDVIEIDLNAEGFVAAAKALRGQVARDLKAVATTSTSLTTIVNY